MVVWAIASSDNREDVESYVEQLGLTYPVLIDPGGAVHRDYALESAFPSAAFPQDWVVGNDGRIIYANNGFELDAMVTAVESQL